MGTDYTHIVDMIKGMKTEEEVRHWLNDQGKTLHITEAVVAIWLEDYCCGKTPEAKPDFYEETEKTTKVIEKFDTKKSFFKSKKKKK